MKGNFVVLIRAAIVPDEVPDNLNGSLFAKELPLIIFLKLDLLDQPFHFPPHTLHSVIKHEDSERPRDSDDYHLRHLNIVWVYQGLDEIPHVEQEK